MAMQAGYYRDYDSTLYVTRTGTVYLVGDPESVEPIWRECGTDLGDDARPARLDAADVQAFERVRVAYGIPA
jgi:hypothetical protein